ncbi:MAG: tripartite tricarboxylate transporter substrate binding protein [Betaproteobacteria bacterium]|nr:tripartite tricarboxylate transporter substrate binding protein [Betaproteobacteria bacterium]
MRAAKSIVVLVWAAVFAGWSVQSVVAQVYPVKPVRIVVAQAAGSATDFLSRLIGQKLSDRLGQPVVVDNRPGAGGTLGTELVARAAPDGYTLLMGNNSTHGANPVLYRNLPYDAVKDFAPITMTTVTPYVIVVHPSLPVKTVKQLITLAKSRPEEINYASAGNGSSQHLAGELFKWMARINMVHVPYKGGAPAMTAVMGGEVSVMFPTAGLVLPHIRNNKVKAIAVTTAKRSDVMPDLPTVSEAALPGYEMVSWFGLLAPAGTPVPIVSRLNAEVVKLLQAPEMKSGLTHRGLEVLSGPPEQFSGYIKAEIAKTAKLAKAAGIKAE